MTQYESVVLYRFDPTANEHPKHPSVIRDLREVCQRHIDEHGDGAGRLVNDDEWPPLSLRMPDYSVDLWPGLVIFNIPGLSPPIAELMFQLAKAGDFSVVLPGVVMLTDPGQRDRLPKSWKKMKVLSCRSAEELKRSVHEQYLGIPQSDRKCPAELFVPGAFPDRARAVYIEAIAKETAAQQQRKVYKYRPENDPKRPEAGMLVRTSGS